MSEIRLYIDENIKLVVAEQLILWGIDVVTAHSLDKLGDTDSNHLKRATEMGRVLCTHDIDFLRMHGEGAAHMGIAFGEHYLATVGDWVKALRALHARMTAEEIKGTVQYLKVK